MFSSVDAVPPRTDRQGRGAARRASRSGGRDDSRSLEPRRFRCWHRAVAGPFGKARSPVELPTRPMGSPRITHEFHGRGAPTRPGMGVDFFALDCLYPIEMPRIGRRNPRESKPIFLVWLGLALVRLGGIWPEAAVGVGPAAGTAPARTRLGVTLGGKWRRKGLEELNPRRRTVWPRTRRSPRSGARARAIQRAPGRPRGARAAAAARYESWPSAARQTAGGPRRGWRTTAG